jgi:CHASE2 domain-containing sensor protein
MSGAMGKLASFWTGIRERRADSRSSRTRILFWSTLAALIFGGFGIGQPLDDILRTSRNKVRQHAASGEIVIVGIDDKSLARVGGWPWPRRRLAELTDNLAGLGAKNIFFDLDLSLPTTVVDDDHFASALRRLPQRPTLATRFVIDPVTGKQTNNFPIPNLRKHADVANINVWYSAFGYVWSLPYALDYAGGTYPSLSAAIAATEGFPSEQYPIDYAIDPTSIPFVSAVDIIEGRVSPHRIAGKRILIGTTSNELGDIYGLPGYSRMAGVYTHALGAETLRNGRPLHLGWLAAFLVTLGFVAASTLLRSGRVMATSFAALTLAVLLLPLALEARLIFTDVSPSLFLLVVTGASIAWSTFNRSYREQGIINSVSGLPNLNALRQERNGAKRTLIAARIQNYAEVASALPRRKKKRWSIRSPAALESARSPRKSIMATRASSAGSWSPVRPDRSASISMHCTPCSEARWSSMQLRSISPSPSVSMWAAIARWPIGSAARSSPRTRQLRTGCGGRNMILPS